MDLTPHQHVHEAVVAPTAAETPLADELRQLIPLRSRSSLRDRHLPILFALLDPADRDPRDRRYAALTTLIDQGITAMDDPAHRAAATALLGSGPGRWRTVGQRGGEAAAAFACGWDAYRRRRTNGTSQLDDTVAALAEALTRGATPGGRGEDTAVAVVPEPSHLTSPPAPAGLAPNRPVVIASGPSDLALTAPDLGRAAARARPRRRVLIAATAGALLVALAAAALIVGLPPASVAACDLLTHSPGELPPGADAELRQWAPRFRALAATLPASEVTCAGPMGRRAGTIEQQVSRGDGHLIGALMATTAGSPHVVFLRHGEYWSYRTSLDLYGRDLIGIPVGRADRKDGTQVVELTRGVLVSEGPTPPTFLVIGRAWDEWRRRGGLDGDIGRPVSNTVDISGVGRVQEFTGGRLITGFVDGEIRWDPDPSPQDGLPADYLDTVLVSPDGMAWFVDRHGVRRLLPTANDFNCAIGGTAQKSGISAAAIATLRPGTPWRCR